MLSFSDAIGNFFNLVGRLGGIAKQLRSYQNTIEDIMTNTTDGVVAQTKNEADVQAIMGSNYIGILQSTSGSVTPVMQSIASAYLNRLVYRDQPRYGQSLQSSNTASSLGLLIQQMKQSGATVWQQSVAGSATSFTGDGDGVLNVSVKRGSDGAYLENLTAEQLTVICTVDSYLSGATPFNETLAVVGTGTNTDVFAFDWPNGSGSSATIQSIDGNQDNSAGNLLTNSGFEAFTSNVPDNWSLDAGVAGTDVFEEDSIVFDPTAGGKSVKIVSDGLTQVQLSQLFDSTTGTSGTLATLAQYSFCLFLCRDGGSNLTGTLTVDLFDGTNVVSDQAGIANSVAIDLSTVGVGFSPFTGAFRLPLKMPSSIYLRLRFTTPFDAARAVYIDKLSLGQMTQLYASGPYVACHSGSRPFVTGDYAYLTFTNGRAADGSLDTFQTLLARLFPEMLSQEILLPSSTVPSISDTLIR